MASGLMNRVKRPDTWLHRPMLQNVKKVLANPEPSTHDPELTSPTCGTYSHEITKAKAMLVVAFAREHRHPLQCVIELKCRPSESCFCALLRSGGRHRLIVGADRK